MEFNKYPSINTKIKPLDGKYIVTEKIDGANFGFYCNGKVVKFARRRSIIQTQKEYNFFKLDQAIRVQFYKQNIMNLYNKMTKQKEYNNIKYIIVYGEIFGGWYLGLKSGPCAVQKKVYYCNEIDFMAFDLKIFTDNDTYFESYDKRSQLFDIIDIPYLKPLFRGDIKTCTKYPIDFDSTIPDILKMPPLKKRNLVEGIVICHSERFFFNNNEVDRSIVKIKNKKFYEVKTKKTQYVNTVKKNTIIVYNSNELHKNWKKVMDAINKIMPEILLYVTENRYNNIISHEWEKGKKVMKPYIEDVIKDYSQEHADIWNIFDEKSKSIINKKIGREFLKKLSKWNK